MAKFANSKLYKRVLVFALVACMLCSVLVAGIGTGITAKAADGNTVEVSFWFNGTPASGGWFSGDITENLGNGTHTLTANVSSIPSDTDISNCKLSVYADTSTFVDPSAFAISDVSFNLGTTGVDNTIDWSGTWETENYYGINGADFADYTWTGNETISVTFTLAGIEVAVEEEEPATSSSDATTSDTDTESDGLSIAATMNYYNTSGGTGWDGTSSSFTFTGSGTYTFKILPTVFPEDSIGSPCTYISLPGLSDALSAKGYGETDVVVSGVVTMDGVEVPVTPAYTSWNNEIGIFNPWNDAFGTTDVTWSDNVTLAITITLPEEFGTGSCDLTIGEAEAAPEEEDDGPLKGTTGTKKANGYIHDKGAIFVYTGSKDINDFTIATGWAFGKVHEINGKWGDSYFGDGGLAGVGTNEGTSVKGNGIYIKYWEDYRGIGYPAIQLSWDTDRIFYIGDITIFSSDWSTQAVFSVGDGFYRGPEERYAGTGEALLDGSNKWYYFGEGTYKAATSTTATAEDTASEDVGYDTSKWADLEDTYVNEVLTCGEGEGAAYIMYADESWTNQYWHDGGETAFKAEDVLITGEGDYVVGLSCKNPAKGLAFTALGIKGGEAAFPEYCFTITAMTVNGKLINYEKPYTSSDDAVETRSNIYNAWVSELPDDARVAYGDLTECTPTIVDTADFANVNEFKVYFTVTAPGAEFDYDAKVVETLTNLVNDGTLTQEEVDQYIVDNEIVVPEA